jgi:hypothetical protein
MLTKHCPCTRFPAVAILSLRVISTASEIFYSVRYTVRKGRGRSLFRRNRKVKIRVVWTHYANGKRHTSRALEIKTAYQG